VANTVAIAANDCASSCTYVLAFEVTSVGQGVIVGTKNATGNSVLLYNDSDATGSVAGFTEWGATLCVTELPNGLTLASAVRLSEMERLQLEVKEMRTLLINLTSDNVSKPKQAGSGGASGTNASANLMAAVQKQKKVDAAETLPPTDDSVSDLKEEIRGVKPRSSSTESAVVVAPPSPTGSIASPALAAAVAAPKQSYAAAASAPSVSKKPVASNIKR